MSLTIGKAIELAEKLKNNKDPAIAAYTGFVQSLIAKEIDKAKKDYRAGHDLSSVKVTSGDLFDKVAFLRTAVGGARRRKTKRKTTKKRTVRRKKSPKKKSGGARKKRRSTKRKTTKRK